MVIQERLKGHDKTTGGTYSKWLATFVKVRKFNLEEAFVGHVYLLKQVTDLEDRAYLSAIGEVRRAYVEGNKTLMEEFPKGPEPRRLRLGKQMKVVHNATPIPEWEKVTVSESSFATNGDFVRGEVQSTEGF